jgi:hypothetical protein
VLPGAEPTGLVLSLSVWESRPHGCGHEVPHAEGESRVYADLHTAVWGYHVSLSCPATCGELSMGTSGGARGPMSISGTSLGFIVPCWKYM